MSSDRAIAVGLLLAITAGCAPDCTPPPGGGPAPIVLLITVDTLRADHLGSDGRLPIRTPHLDRVAAQGLRFSRAYAAVNATLPSHVSLFTSQPARRHGVDSNDPTQATATDTVFGSFRASGYRTAAFVSAYHVGPKMVLGQLLEGLERFEAPRRVSKPYLAEQTVDAALAWLGGACSSRAFAWIHLWDPHMPYAPPVPFDRAYYAGDPTSPAHDSLADVELSWALHDRTGLRRHLRRHARVMRDLKRVLGVNGRESRRLVVDPAALRQHTADAAQFRRLYAEVKPVLNELHRTLPLHPQLAGMLVGVRDIAFPRAQYAGEVSYVDREVGRLLSTLETWGLRDRLIVVVTADHGEGLGEHDIYWNHFGLFDEIVRVPLLVWAPGSVPPGVRHDLTGGVDVAPTLLALAGLAVPATMEGRDLIGNLAERPIVSEAMLGREIALRHGDWKLVRTLRDYYVTTAFFHEAGDVALYDLRDDPREQIDLAVTNPTQRDALDALLEQWLQAHGKAIPSAPASPEGRHTDRLRALGYVE